MASRTGCCQGRWLFAQNSAMFPGGIALLMEQESDSRVQKMS